MEPIHTDADFSNALAARESIKQTLLRSCLLLDEERFDEWLAVCAPEFSYSIEAYSTEIRRHMTWLDLDRAGLRDLFDGLKLHERDAGILHRHVSELIFDVQSEDEMSSISSLLIVRTALDGTSRLYAAGRYYDRWIHRLPTPLLAARRVVLSTRVLMSDAGGSHVPF